MLCAGDLMLDEFVYGGLSRISPEAPGPVIAVVRQDAVIGGAGNVARNVASLGARCLFVGVVGDDDARAVRAALAGEPNIEVAWPVLTSDVSIISITHHANNARY